MLVDKLNLTFESRCQKSKSNPVTTSFRTSLFCHIFSAKKEKSKISKKYCTMMYFITSDLFYIINLTLL